MRSFSCTVGETFIIDAEDGTTRVTVLETDLQGVHLRIEERGETRDVLVPVAPSTGGRAELLATVG